MAYEVNQQALEQYKKRMYEAESERYTERDFLPGTDPNTPTRRKVVTSPKRKVQGDRSLRVDDWAGGKPKRTWKVKAHVPSYTYEDNFLFKGGSE